MLSDAYATPQLYRALIHKSDPGQDEDVRGDLLAVSRYLEGKLHTFFNKDDELTLRYFDAPIRMNNNSWSNAWTASGIGYAEMENPFRYMQGGPLISIDPIADITGLEIFVDTNRDYAYSTLLASTDYILLPRNALVGPEPRPYDTLSRTNNSNWVPGANLKINAIWGWPAVPKAIERACVHITAILRIESPRATSSVDVMDRAVGASKECQDIVHNLMRSYNKQPSFGNSGVR